jgi:hypothetical protein
MARTNLCPNPSLKNDATGWFGGGVRVTGSTGMARATAFQNAGTTDTLPRATVTAGLTYRFSAYVKGTGGGSSGNANINWYSGGAYLSSAPGQGWSVTTGQVTRIESGAQVAPAGADQGLLNITGVDAQVEVTAVLYEQTSSLFEFFDGDSGGCSWNGTAGNSTSTNPVGDSGGDTPPPDPGGGSDEAAITQGWGTPIWQSDFSPGTEGQLTDNTWGLYDGPGHAGNGTRDPERISITDGVLRLQGTSGGSGAGMAHRVVKRRYGRWEARMRAYSTGGTAGQKQWHPVLIVWPDSDNWPVDGEYDFIESDVGDTAGANIHYPHPNLPVQQEQFTDSSKQMSDYHNYAIDWQPSGITGYIDGVQWYHVSGGGGPNGRSNIQNMPSGHLTVQLDNFGGSPHRPANMDVDWVRIYDNTSVASNNAITCTGIPSANQGGFVGFGAATVGNRFRLYLNNTASAVSVTPAAWEQTAGAAASKLLGRNRVGANTSVTVAETSTSNTFDSLLGQWISDPFTSSGTVQGGWQWCLAANESDVAADVKMAAVIRVVSGDGTTVRGLFADTLMSGELGTIINAFVLSAPAGTPVAAQVGDRLVIEIGYRATNTSTTSYSATLRYGGTAGDVEQDDVGAAITTKSAWVQFADGAVKALFTGQTISTTGIPSSEAVGGTVVTVPPTRALSAVGGIASTEVVPSPVVHAEAAIIAPAGIAAGGFGTAAVSNGVVETSIPSEEAIGSHRVRRLSDLVVDLGIPSGETFGVLVVVHFQAIAPAGLTSAEAFGNTQVEDPARKLFPFSILSAEQFGIPLLKFRLRSKSIESAEAFGLPTLKVGRWKLVQPTRIERWRLGDDSWNVIYVTNVVGLTVYGDNSGLSTIENPKTEQVAGAQYVWQGGHDNITEDQAIRDLWLANGYQVEMSY